MKPARWLAALALVLAVPAGNVKTYTSPKGVNRNVLDVNAFPDL